MAFIVEMWWGRPSELIVQEGPPDPERRTFSCHGDNWEVAQRLGREFGWKPKGPLMRRFADRDGPPVREASYAPDGWMEGIHEVEADARAWGAALEACVRDMDAGGFELPALRSSVLLREGMTLDEYRQANRGLTVQFLRSFAAFLAKGAFKFGWDS